MPAEEEKGEARTVEILEVEDEEQRQARMHDVFARLDASSSRSPALPLPSLPTIHGQSPTPLEPNLELLSRVQAFLPQLAESNAELVRRAQSDPSAVDIENVHSDEAYIEMGSNLGLGVFEQRRHRDPGSQSSSDDEMSSDEDSSSSTSSDATSSSSDSESGSDSTSSSSSSSSASSPSPRPIKPLPQRRPRITVLETDKQEHGS